MKKINIIYGLLAVAILFGSTYNIAINTNKFRPDTPLAQASNENGEGNPFYYELRKSDGPDKCTLFKVWNAEGQIIYSGDKPYSGQIKVGWDTSSITGIIELCPKTGKGCTAFSCQETK